MAEALIPDKRAVRRAFGRSAHTYDAAAVLQREVCSRLLEHLDPIRLQPARILDLGCGTGEALSRLGKRFPASHRVGIDLAASMLQRTAARTPGWKRWLGSRAPALICADAERVPLAPGSVDLAFSNLMLQWCGADRVFHEAARVLRNEGLILFSTFGPDTLRELRAAFRAADDAEHVTRFIDMHDLGDALVHAGFADPVMEMETITLEYDSVRALVNDLRSLGAVNARPDRPRGLMGHRRWRRMEAAYENLRRDGVLPATWEIVYGHAWKVPPKRLADGRQVIGFTSRPRT